METLRSFIVNTKKKILTFSYKKKKTTPHDVTLKADFITPEDIKDISKIIIQETRKSIQNMQKEVDKTITNKNEEISRLKDHSEKLLA